MDNIKTNKQISISLLVLLAGFAAIAGYHIITCDTEIDFNINWNMFNSPLAWPLFIVGLILGLGQKFHVYEPWIGITDASGKTELKKSDDVTDVIGAGCLMPLLQYLVIGPVMIAALIYYLLMGVVCLFGVIFPYFIVAFIIMTLVLFYKLENRLILRPSRVWTRPLAMILSVGFVWLLYFLWVPGGDTSIFWTGMIAAGIAVATAVFFAVNGYREKKNGYGNGNFTGTAAISRPFLIAYVICFLLTFGIYGFKAQAKHSDRQMDNSSRSSQATASDAVDLTGTRVKGYDDYRALTDKLGFWCGANQSYDNNMTIERWENKATGQLWLVLLEKFDSGESVVCDVLKYSLKSVVDVNPFPVYNKNTEGYTGYMMVQIDKDNNVVKVYDVDYKTKKITAEKPASYLGKAQTEWDTFTDD